MPPKKLNKLIRLLDRSEIDDKRWNGCVHFAHNNFPYGYTWYLDQLTEEWSGVVMGGYDAVMPVVWKKKWGVSYMYQPLFCQQLGVFADFAIPPEVVKGMCDEIPDRFKWRESHMNFANDVKMLAGETRSRTNLVINLSEQYENIYDKYNKRTRRNLKSAQNNKLKLDNLISPEKVVAFYAEHTGRTVSEFRTEHEHALHRLIYRAMHYNSGSIWAVRDENNSIVAANFFVHSRTRIVSLLNSSSTEGKKLGAPTYLIDFMIQKFATKPLIFDFEGSEIEGVAEFYRGFGADVEQYHYLKQNELPWPLKLLKK